MTKQYFLADQDLHPFVETLMAKYPVIAPVAKRSRFAFEKLEVVDDLRLDYDTTVLPPKMAFFPPKQNLITFDSIGFKSCLEPKPQILFGVHPHDIKGIAMSDAFYQDRKVDTNYMANRASTTIVGSSVQKHYKYAFFGSINADTPVAGHDMFLTQVAGGFVVDTLTDKGEALIADGAFGTVTDAQVTEAQKVNADAEANCPQKIDGTAAEIKDKVRASFESKIWDELASDCFSCGSCNIVCPTCYCFDVQDEWNVDAKTGSRFRLWDACLTSEFSEVTSPGGAENFREERAERYRHRFMRKAAYLNELMGGPACTGCGRCSGACTADIANPVTVINTILEQ